MSTKAKTEADEGPAEDAGPVEGSVDGGAEAAGARILRKKQIVEQVAVATGLKRRDVREALDSAFAITRQALSDGQDVDYPTLGKIRVKAQTRPSGRERLMYRVTLAKSPPAAPGETPPAGEGTDADTA
ncbi:MAG: HU family DNA-binding protein [Pseudomonadota bacterium]